MTFGYLGNTLLHISNKSQLIENKDYHIHYVVY